MRKIVAPFLGLVLGGVEAAPSLAEAPAPLPPAPLATPNEASLTSELDQTGLNAYLRALRPQALAAGVPSALYDREIRTVAFMPELIERDRTQGEFTRAIWDYLDIAVSAERVATGRAMLKRHGPALKAIEERYRVEPWIVVAVWGLETSFGAVRGKTDTLSALATLAYEGRRRAFFEAELLAALAILAEGHTTRAQMRGSWAGAMGHTQFMPSSWARFAVDFNGDGRRDIWGEDPTDALASTAHYLAQHGWAHGEAWGAEVALPAGFDLDLVTPDAARPLHAWKKLGLSPMAPTHLAHRTELLLPAGATGPAFAIGGNFRAIEAYNPADAYVIGIGHLGDRINGGDGFYTPWPRHLRALSREERVELQQRLQALGQDTGGADGRIGPKTVAAIKVWQRRQGSTPDGFASLEVLETLRSREAQ